MNPFELALSGCGSPLAEETFENYAKAGIKGYEISLPEDLYSTIPWNDVYNWAKSTGVELWSFHSPFSPFEIADITAFDSLLRKRAIDFHSEYIKKAARIGIKNIIMHPSGEPYPDSERADRINYAKESLSILADIAESAGAVIAVENLPRTCIGRDSSEILEITNADDRLRICFDTNHLLSEPIKDFIKKAGSKIITTHFSDYDFKNERHWLPGEGLIDWKELVEELKSVGYTGPVLYEVSLKAPATINRSRNLTYDDFVKNYNSLINNETPSVIGTPILKMCKYWKEI